jgi:hypothetical protein
MLAALKERLAELVDPPIPGDVVSVPTGVVALDRVLPGGGLPRGRLTEIRGAPGSGRTTFVRDLVARALGDALWVACIDGTRTFAPRDWAPLGAHAGLWIVRPRDPARAAWCADVLLRSGAFPLVVLDGAPQLPRPVAVRLVRLARDANAAFVLTGDIGPKLTLGGALRLHVFRDIGTRDIGTSGESRATRPPPSHDATRRPDVPIIAIAIEKGAVPHTVEVCRVAHVARRLCANPEVPDRRGVAARRGAAAAPSGGPGERAGLAPNRKRRCAEPDVEPRAFVSVMGE